MKPLYSSKLRYFICKIIPERLGHYFSWSTTVLLFVYFVLDDRELFSTDPSQLSNIFVPLLYLPLVIVTIAKRYNLERNVYDPVRPFRKDLFLSNDNTIYYEGKKLDLSTVRIINVNKVQAINILTIRRTSLIKHYVRLIRIGKHVASGNKKKKNPFATVSPEKDLFFIARYSAIDAIVIFSLSLFTLGFVKDVPEKLFLKRVLSPFLKAMGRDSGQICYSKNICTQLYNDCDE